MMDNKRADRQRAQNAISNRYLVRFVVQVLAMTGVLIALVFIAWFIAGQRVWHAYEPLYQLLRFLADYVLLLGALCWLGGMLIILIVQWRSMAKSVLALVDTIEVMADDDAAPITLPEDLRELQPLLQQVQTTTAYNRRLANEAEQRKNDMIVYLAHDLKTPLTSVLGYLTLLRDEPDISDALRQKYLDIATTKAQRLEDLINEFFEITRFNIKGLVLEPTRLNLSRMLEQVSDEFRPLLAPKQLKCTLQVQPDIWMMADAGKLERVADNLLRNAISYSHPGTEITVGAVKEDNLVRMWVINTGDTIPQHKLSQIFEQFYRVDASRSGEEGGAGLGLAIAKEIVERHGGNIFVQSADEMIEFIVQMPVGQLPIQTVMTDSGYFNPPKAQ